MVFYNLPQNLWLEKRVLNVPPFCPLLTLLHSSYLLLGVLGRTPILFSAEGFMILPGPLLNLFSLQFLFVLHLSLNSLIWLLSSYVCSYIVSCSSFSLEPYPHPCPHCAQFLMNQLTVHSLRGPSLATQWMEPQLLSTTPLTTDLATPKTQVRAVKILHKTLNDFYSKCITVWIGWDLWPSTPRNPALAGWTGFCLPSCLHWAHLMHTHRHTNPATTNLWRFLTFLSQPGSPGEEVVMRLSPVIPRTWILGILHLPPSFMLSPCAQRPQLYLGPWFRFCQGRLILSLQVAGVKDDFWTCSKLGQLITQFHPFLKET